MFQSDSARERAKLIDSRLAKLRAQRDRLISRASRAERRRDTRQKIVIGGTILAAVDADGVPPLPTLADLQRWLAARLTRPADRALFALDPPAR